MQYSALPGWFAYEALYDHAVSTASDKSTLVEVGCWFGRGLVYLAQRAKERDLVGEKTLKVYGVATQTHAITTISLLDNLEQCGVSDAVTVLPMYSESAVKFFSDKSLHFVFLDRTVSRTNLVSDINLWRPKIATGGILAGAHYSLPRVRDAVTQMLGEDRDCDICPSCWWYKP